MSHNKPAIIGLDIGNGRLNACAGEGQYLDIPSRIYEVNDVLIEQDHIYKDKGRNFLVGEDAVAHSNLKRREIDSEYYKSDEYAVLCRYAIKKLGFEGKDVALVIGLPVHLFKSHHRKLKDAVLKISPAIKNVVVQPQPIGTLTHIQRGWDNKPLIDLAGKRVAVVDIGHGTLDAVEVKDNVPTPDKMDGNNEGIGLAFNALRSTIFHKYKLDVTMEDIQQAWGTGEIEVDGETKSIKNLINDQKNQRIFAVADLVDSLWGNAKGIGKFVFTGGGAMALRKELEKHILFKGKIIIPEDAQLANCIGFYKLGLILRGAGRI